jgi:hypothetical protein
MKAALTLGFIFGVLFGLCSTPARADKVGEGKVPFMVEKKTGKKFYVRPVVHHFRTRNLASNPKTHQKLEPETK